MVWFVIPYYSLFTFLRWCGRRKDVCVCVGEEVGEERERGKKEEVEGKKVKREKREVEEARKERRKGKLKEE